MPIRKILKKIHGRIKTFSRENTDLEKLLYSAKKRTHTTIDISVSSVAKSTLAIILLLALSYFLYLILNIIVLFLVALFLSAAFEPIIGFLERHYIPRILGIIIIYIILLGIITILVTSLIPIIITQIAEIADNLRYYLGNIFKAPEKSLPLSYKLKPFLRDIWVNLNHEQFISNFQNALTNFGAKLSKLAGNAFGAIIAISHGIVNAIIVLLLTFFMSVNKESISKFFQSLFPKKYKSYIVKKTNAVQKKIGEWVIGIIFLCLTIGILTFIGLKILGIKYAATLALVAGIAELVPYLGALITWSLTVPIAFNQSPLLVVFVTILYIIIQQAENHLLVPLVMRKAVGLSPIAVIFAVLVGAKFLGILGIILAVPAATIVSIFIQDYTDKKK